MTFKPLIFENFRGQEVVGNSLYQKILAQNLLIFIGLHCVNRSSWSATTLATLLRIPKPRVHPSKICHSLRSLWDWKAFQCWFDMIWLNYCALCILYWLSPLPTCLLYFTILAHKPSVRPSIVRFLVRRWVFVHGPLIERHLVQDCHIVKMVIEFRVFVFKVVIL